MRKSVALAVLLISVSGLASAQNVPVELTPMPPADVQAVQTPAPEPVPFQAQVPASVETYTPPPMPQEQPSAQAGMPRYEYSKYKIDRLYREVPFVALAQAVKQEVRKDERGLLWTYTDFKVLQAVKGSFKDNTFTVRVVGGSRSEPLLNESLNTGGLDLLFTPGDHYFMFIEGVNDANYPIIARQHVYVVTGQPGSQVISDLKGGSMKIKRTDGSTYKPYEPVLVSDLVNALAKIK